MIRRLLITSVLLLAGAGYLAHATRAETVPPRRPLTTLPLRMDPWEGRESQPFAANVLAVAIPCHRIVRKDGALSGYRWGVERKRELLKREAMAK